MSEINHDRAAALWESLYRVLKHTFDCVNSLYKTHAFGCFAFSHYHIGLSPRKARKDVSVLKHFLIISCR
jgi:hypothetical protein